MPATPARFEDLPDLLTVDETASWTRKGRRQTYELIRAGELPSVRLGRSIRVPKGALARFIGVAESD